MLLLAATGGSLAAQPLVTVALDRVLPGSAGQQQLAERLLGAAVNVAAVRYGGYLVPRVAADIAVPGTEAAAPAYAATLTAIFQQDGDDVLTLELVRVADGAEAESLTILGDIRPQAAERLAGNLFYQWASLNGYLADAMVAPPQLVEQLPIESIASTLVPEFPAMLMPLSAAARPNGNLLLGFGMVGAELDAMFRIVDRPGRSLFEAGNYSYATSVAATPSGTVFYRPAIGREVYRIIDGAPRPQRWSTGVDIAGPFAALGDGSVVITDAINRQAFKVHGRRRSPFPVYTSEYSHLAALTVGPEGNLWVYDAYERRLKIHAIDGTLIDTVVPLLDQSAPLTPSSMAVFANGTFVLSGQQQLRAFRRDGRPLWLLDELPDGEQLPLQGFVAVDAGRGIVYLADQLGRRVIQLVDWVTAGELGAANQRQRQLIELADGASGAGSGAAAGARAASERAALYEQAGALQMASALWQRVLEERPFDPRADAELDRLQVAVLHGEAAELHDRTLATLAELGPESARASFSQTVQVYEKILSRAPQDHTAGKALATLRAAFAEAAGQTRPKKRPLAVTELELQGLFPSLSRFYSTHPVGRIVIENPLDEPVHELQVALHLRNYMDFPTAAAPVAVLRPGESVELALSVVLNDRVFELQEHLPVQAQVTIDYLVAGEQQQLVRNVATTLHSRTALTWDSSAKLATFITPNEPSITSFAHRAARIDSALEVFRLSDKLFQAMRVCDALGTHNVHYIEDPESPITQILGNPEWVDTVRFPRTTLVIQSGDCDDTSALLASLLESIGIRTAIMTSPGHVFMAFDTGEPEENLWLFRSLQLEALTHEGTVWVPVETTVLGDGFLAAWMEASRLVRTYRDSDQLEFVPLYQVRPTYPPVALPPSTFDVVVPTDATIDALFDQTVAGVVGSMYGSALEQLQTALAARQGREQLAIRSQIGILHARFGNTAEAQRVLEETVRADPAYVAGYVNLANLRYSAGDYPGAIAVLQRGLRQRPDSVYLNLALARSHYARGDAGAAERAYAVVEQRAPRLAARYTYLTGDSAGGRAGAPGAGLPLIWASADE